MRPPPPPLAPAALQPHARATSRGGRGTPKKCSKCSRSGPGTHTMKMFFDPTTQQNKKRKVCNT